MILITNYITTAWRNILRHKLFSIINILGLAIGLAAVMLIALYVRYETSYDSFWKNADNIYRVQGKIEAPGMDTVKFARIGGKLKSFFERDFPEIEKATRILPPFPKPSVIHKNQTFEENIVLTDPELMDIFDFRTVEGNLNGSISDNNEIVLTESLAHKYFADKPALGKILSLKFNQFERDYTVTAVIEDVPKNSMLDFAAFARIDENDFSETQLFKNEIWPNSFFYFTLRDGVDISGINERMPGFIDRNYTTRLGVSDSKKSDVIFLESLSIKDLYLKSEGEFETKPRGDRAAIPIFALVSLLILLIASINFMNLSTARAGIRAKEISLRKLVGADQKTLIIQFVSESVLLAFLSLFIALAIVEASLPLYGEMLNSPLAIDYASPDLIIISLLTLLTGLLGGAYPAVVLSRFRPAYVLKSGQNATDNSNTNLRKSLVIIQFTISIILFVSTAVIFSQMEYVKSKDLGFNKENLLVIPVNNRDQITIHEESLMNELKRLENVVNVTKSGFTVASDGSAGEVYYTDEITSENAVITSYREVGYDFFETYDIPLLAGRSYLRDRADKKPSRAEVMNGDPRVGSIILNKTALDRLNLGTPEQAIGKVIYQDIGTEKRGTHFTYQVIGVVDNLDFNSLKSEPKPEIYDLVTNYTEAITIRFKGSPTDIIDEIEAVWKSIIPGVTFQYDHVIDKIINQYLTEKGQMTMFAAFSGLAIFIACLGLFGLASFTAERRTKEIGIRKVLGAEVWQIVRMLVFQFSKPVLIANIIAWPVAYLAMSRWLESFVYRIDDMVIIALCLLAGLTALLIAWATVAGNSYAVARQNPIKALRYE